MKTTFDGGRVGACAGGQQLGRGQLSSVLEANGLRARTGGMLRGVFALALVVTLAMPAFGAGSVTNCTEASLRAALLGGGLVAFSNDCSITLSAQIDIGQADTTIDAGGHTVSIAGGSGTPLFHVRTNLTLRGLSLVNGASPTSGGALYIEPGVVVIATHCIFAGNSALGTNGFAGSAGTTNSNSTGGNGGNGTAGVSALGGAIYNQGALALVNCTLTNNTAVGGAGGAGGAGGPGGGIFAVGGDGGDGGDGGGGLGGAVYNLGNLTLINCNFFSNTALGGAGGQGGAAGTGSYAGLSGNGGMGGSGQGAAVFNAGNLSVSASAFATNFARGGASATAGMHGNGTGIAGRKGGFASGGAIHNNWWAVVTNSTFFTNSVVGGAGGAGGAGGGTFGVPGDGGDGGDGFGGSLANLNTATLVNCTFSTGGAFGGTNGVAGTGSLTGSSGKPGAAQGGNIANQGPIFILMNSILTASPSGANAFGPLTDGGYNLSSDAISSLGNLSIQNSDPKLGTLGFFGGPTPTMPLLTKSPAIDKIPPDASPSTDQRGVSRPINGLSDIGAYEFGAVITSTNIMLSIGRTTNGLTRVTGQGTSGLSYVVQASTNLSNWQNLATNTTSISFTDPATNLPVRFYRITH